MALVGHGKWAIGLKTEHQLPALIHLWASAKGNTQAYTQCLPLHALPGKDVCGIHDVFSNFYTASLF